MNVKIPFHAPSLSLFQALFLFTLYGNPNEAVWFIVSGEWSRMLFMIHYLRGSVYLLTLISGCFLQASCGKCFDMVALKNFRRKQMLPHADWFFFLTLNASLRPSFRTAVPFFLRTLPFSLKWISRKLNTFAHSLAKWAALGHGPCVWQLAILSLLVYRLCDCLISQPKKKRIKILRSANSDEFNPPNLFLSLNVTGNGTPWGLMN